MQIIFFFKYDNKQIFERKKKDLDKKMLKPYSNKENIDNT